MVTKLKNSFGVGQFLLFAAAGLAFMRPVLGEEPSITPGSTNGALTYYTNLSRILVGFSPTPGLTTLDNVSAFLGYPISGQKLETLDPAVLMAPDRLALEGGVEIPALGLGGARLRDGDILAARFFAPKIVNVSPNIPTPGWRKLVRLHARADSPAARSGVESMIILFNFLAASDDPQPFSGHSFNTQVMLLAPSLPDRLYWLDFDAQQKLTLALNASFDAALLQSTGNHDYFVPDGCNACHGSPGNYAPPMVNYLDTDHWFDRLEDDFKPLKAAGTPLVFDAQTNDFSQPSFARAFDVIRRFNEEALLQNSLVRPHSFEAEAARTWLRLHAQSNEHFPPVARGFALNGGTTWQPSGPTASAN